MANPFGGSDEALTVNQSHANYGNLIYAIIPRSASKVVEVINAQQITNLTGAYDADGYWHPNTTTLTAVEFTPTGITCVSTKTVISGWFRDAGAALGDYASEAGFRNSATGVAYSRASISAAGDAASARTQDNSYVQGPTTGASAVTSNTTFAFAHGQDSAGPNQKSWKRVGGSNTAMTPTTATFGTGASNNFDKVGFRNTSRFRFQYLFVYNAYLSDQDIDSIIDSPGDVLTYGGSGQPSGKRLGGVPFATLNRGVW